MNTCENNTLVGLPENLGHKTKGLCRVKERCGHSSDNHGYSRH